MVGSWGHLSTPDEELWPPAKQTHEWAPLEADSSAPVKSADDTALGNTLMATSWETLSQSYSAKLFTSSWPTEAVR